MMGKTHAAAGLLTGLVASNYLNLSVPNTAVCCGAAMIGSLIVDCDHRNSIATQSSGLFGFITSHLFTHRGIMHTPFFYLLLNGVLLFLLKIICPSEVFDVVSIIIIMFFLGELSHLILDSFNPLGIMWLYPYKKKRFHISRIETGSWSELFVRWLCILGIFTMFFLQASFLQSFLFKAGGMI